MNPFNKIGVLGAGVMGAQIAAHCANAGIAVQLFDLAGKTAPNEIVQKGINGLKKLEPSPIGASSVIDEIESGNYQEDLSKLSECDLIIEAIAEKMEWKEALYKQIAPHMAKSAIFATNTSGLSITQLAAYLPADLQTRFCGVHFFNPPRYMPLVELIPHAGTDPKVLDVLETWLTSQIGKNIVRAKDTPNFIANRVGVFSLLAVMEFTHRMRLRFDEVDLLTGTLIGRPKSATYRTCDVVGLDTLAHVIATMQTTNDPWSRYYQPPAWLAELLKKGAFGQKSGAGIYRKVGKNIEVFDFHKKDYALLPKIEVDAEITAILKDRDAGRRLRALRDGDSPQGQFLWAIFREIFHYSAVVLSDIADTARDVDQALCWGFGWREGPFTLWQNAGWKAVAQMIQEDIDNGQTMSNAPLPDWVGSIEGVYQAQGGAYSARQKAFVALRDLPVYQRHLSRQTKLPPKETLFENAGVRAYTHPLAPEILIVSIISPHHTLGTEVLEGLHECINRAERDYRGLVIGHDEPFSVGANLLQAMERVNAGDFAVIERYVAHFQQSMLRVKTARVPVVCAVQGFAFGGGCELLMHAARRVVAFESYSGLVEAGVGLIPSGGGCKEFAIRAGRLAMQTAGKDIFNVLEPIFTNIARGRVAKSALEGREMGHLVDSDPIVMHKGEVLAVALSQAQALAYANYLPPLLAKKVPVMGRTGIANVEMALTNMREGGFISEHDYRVSKSIAIALCGGEVDTGTKVSEQWLLDVERAQFIDLLKTKPTQQRIEHMLATGKPLRN